MKRNPLNTNDALYNEYRKGFEESSEFFNNSKKIEIKRDETEKDTTPEEEEEIEGLEAIIKTFTLPSHDFAFETVTGNEGLKAFARSTVEAIIEAIKAIGRYLYDLFLNKVKRVEAKVAFLKKKRQMKGIVYHPVKYNELSKRLYIPSMVSTNPIWVANCARVAIDFYTRTVEAHKIIIKYLQYKPISQKHLYELKTALLGDLGKKICDGPVGPIAYTTGILPGGRVFNVVQEPGDFDSVLTFFSSAAVMVKLKSPTWVPETAIISNAITVLDEFVKVIKKEQTSTFTLTGNFENAVKKAKNAQGEVDVNTRQYYAWMTNLNKRMVNLNLQYATYIIDGLCGFVNSGLKP